MDNKFVNLGVTPLIIKAIEEMGFVSPTIVQSEAIPLGLKKEDLIVMSKTGSGKTAAFGIPMLQLIDSNGDGPQGLILTPTRELAVQVDNDLKQISKYQKITTTAVYGQHNMDKEIKDLKRGASIVTGTPGRMFDHINRRTLNTKNIKFLVLDEADRMLDMGFIDQVFKIVKALPRQRVTMMFSATLPMEIQRLSKSYMNNPITIELESDTKTVDSTIQIYYKVKRNEKRTQLDRVLRVEQPDSCLVFCNTRDEVDKVYTYLARKGYFTSSLHGANSQSRRMKTLEKIKMGKVQVVVATDVAARGLHIDDLGLVINYDVPLEKDGYVHRIGRTGRAGKMGKAISLVTSDDIMNLYDIEEHVGALIDEEELPTIEQVKKCTLNPIGKWANKKAPIQNTHMAKKSTHVTRKPYKHNTNKTRSNNPKPTTNKPYKKENSKVHHTTKPKANYKPSVNKQTKQKNSLYRERAIQANRKRMEEAKKGKPLLKRISDLVKKK